MEKSTETFDINVLKPNQLGASVKGHGTFVPDSAPEVEHGPSVEDTAVLSAFPDTRNKGSDEVFEMYCETCNRDGKHKPASGFCTSCMSYFCSTCLNYHGMFLPDHRYLEGDKLPQDVCIEKCPVHNTEIIKFYCATCNTFVCSVCKRVDHKEVCAMRYLPNIVQDLERGEEFGQLIINWNHIAKRLSDAERAMGIRHGRIYKISSDVKFAIMKEKDTLFNRFDQEANKIEENVASVMQVENARVSNAKQTIEPLNIEIGKLVHDIKQLSISPKSQKYKLFIALKQVSQRLEQAGHVVEDLTKYDSTSDDAFKYKLEKHADDVIKRVREFGSVAKDNNVKMKETEARDQRKFAHLVGDINVSSARDDDGCHIVDCCVLSEQYLIACDKNNSSVKLIDTKGQGVIYVRHVKTVPEAVTKITDSEFAMVHSSDRDEDRSIIQFLTMTESRALDFQTHFILTEMYCVNIAYVNDDRLIVSMWANHEGKVQVLSMTEKSLLTLKHNKEGEKLFRCRLNFSLRC
ncbi:uncharacterized protein LOC123536138 [Mercenaria mercenaria]|uniref:uncharacterized protein LOC123536138 n=1 Tax=Mercenaria mercenaria TaxID=6596 RepID=UPI00234E456D|nr:uncharacterized protein LOC123536138 [Mercenaria mercenaria]